ncbi:MAG: hypothetical protein R2834_02045 [Rhodothermales bacterium]
MRSKSKQAVLLIHGIGEQRPMDTLRGFVKAVWTTNTAIQHEHARPGVFSKPDMLSGSYELRRITTTQDRNGVRTDFYEFYWAHLMGGTSLGHIASWLRILLQRKPWKLPAHLRGAWVFLVLVIVFVALLAVQLTVPDFIELPRLLTGVGGLIVLGIIVPLINGIVGDAARYLNPEPSNIHRRQEIRSHGVDILNKLHASGQYSRIVVVGHSLGSVIGYDVLSCAWPAYAEQVEKGKNNPVLTALEQELGEGAVDTARYQDRQRALLGELQANGCPWLVTDFITLGSPLAHAELLLAHDDADLRAKQEERELPRCPPVLEAGKISFPAHLARRKLHHAAVFGPTRWTNLYFPARWLVKGDFIGGALRPVFGEGIADVPVHTTRRYGLLTHTLYWKLGPNDAALPHIERLRAAMNMLDALHAPEAEA